MRLPEPIADFFAAFAGPWKKLSTAEFAGWSAFYLLFLLYAFAHRGSFLLIDDVNLVIHEAGHPLFSYLGHTPMVWGGTIFELLVPFALAAYFAYLRQPAGAAFCAFFFFENLLYIAVYMADARAQALPLVTTGDPDYVEHDWNYIFSHLGVLQHDLAIAHFTDLLGWLGMLGTVAWLAWRWRHGRTAGA